MIPNDGAFVSRGTVTTFGEQKYYTLIPVWKLVFKM